MGGIMGGGGGPDIPQRDPQEEWPQITDLYKGQENQYRNFWKRKDPILRNMYDKALNSPLLAELESQGLSQLQEGDSPLLRELQSQGLGLLTGGPSDILEELQGQAMSDLALGGSVSPEEERDRAQRLAAMRSSQGNLIGNQFTAEDLLNRDAYERERLSERRGFATGVEGLSEADMRNRIGLASGIEGLSEGAETNRFNLATQAAQAGIQLPMSIFGGGIQGFSQLTNPILAYASDLFGGNQSAAADEAIAGANKSAGTSGGIMSTIGSIAGAAGAAY